MYRLIFVINIAFALCCLPNYAFAGDDEVIESKQTSTLEASNSEASIKTDSRGENSKETEEPTNALQWLERLAHSTRSFNYEITYVASKVGYDAQPYLWRHAILDSGDKIESLSLLNGPGFERILINDRLSVFEPGYSPYTVEATGIQSPLPNVLFESPQTLFDSYDVLLMGRERILGRMAQKLRIVSKDKSRYGYFLWIDEQTNLLLKFNMLDVNSRLLSQVQVTHINMGEQVKQVFANLQSAQLPPLSRVEPATETNFLWELSYIPSGMKIIQKKLHRLTSTGQPSQYLMLSDGLVDVSVYVMNDTEILKEELQLRNASRSFVSLSNGRIQVIIIGDVPVETAQKIADSIVLVNAELQND